MKALTAVVISAALVAGTPLAGAETFFPGFAGGGIPLKHFDLQRELTAGDIPVTDMQMELLREVPSRYIPSKQDRRPDSAQPGEPALNSRMQRDLF